MKKSGDSRRTKRTKNRLKSALIELRQTKLIRNISVKELCEKAEVNRSTFYLHYDCPEDILLELEEQAILNIEEALENTDFDYGSLDYWTAFLEHIKLKKDFYLLLLTQQEEHQFIVQLKNSCLKAFSKRFLSDTKKNEYLIDYRIAGNVTVLASWLKDENPIPAKSIAKFRFDIYQQVIKVQDGPSN